MTSKTAQNCRLWILLLAIGGLLLPILAIAQPEPGTVRDELERTDRILERAREQVGIAANSRASALLSSSIRMQADAWSAFRARQYGRAGRLTRMARDMARRALETAEIDVKAHEQIRDLIESTRILIQDMSAQLQEKPDPHGARLLEVGTAQLDRAIEAYRARKYREALTLASAARDLVQRARERIQAPGASSGPAVEAALERTDTLLGEVRGRLRERPTPKAEHLVDEAGRLQARARALLRERRLDLALRWTTQARSLALDALFLVVDSPGPQDVERALAVVEQLLQDLSGDLLASGRPEARTLYDSARQKFSDASSALARGDHAAALNAARIAEGLLRRAAEAAGLR